MGKKPDLNKDSFTFLYFLEVEMGFYENGEKYTEAAIDLKALRKGKVYWVEVT